MLVIKSIMKFPVCGNCLDGGFSFLFVCVFFHSFLWLLFSACLVLCHTYTQNKNCWQCLKPPKHNDPYENETERAGAEVCSTRVCND